MLIKRLTSTAKMPTKANPGDLGYDLYSDETVAIRPNDGVVGVPTGIAIEFPSGYGAIIKDRSSMAKSNMVVAGGVIDSEYRGQIVVLFHNVGFGTFYIGKGQKIAQMILTPVVNFEMYLVKDLSETVRGDKGFGSSGS